MGVGFSQAKGRYLSVGSSPAANEFGVFIESRFSTFSRICPLTLDWVIANDKTDIERTKPVEVTRRQLFNNAFCICFLQMFVNSNRKITDYKSRQIN
jgi:hypothetical protein